MYDSAESMHLIANVIVPFFVATGIVFWVPAARNIVKQYLTPRQVSFIGVALPTMIITLMVGPLPESVSLGDRLVIVGAIAGLAALVFVGLIRSAEWTNADKWKE